MKTLTLSTISILIIFFVLNAYGDNSFTTSRAINSDKLIVRFTVENTHPSIGNATKIDLTFVKIGTYYGIVNNVDYKMNIYYNTTSPQPQNIVYSLPLNHASNGTVSIPYQFEKSGFYLIGIHVDKIFDMQIPEESVFFDVNILNLPPTQGLSPHKQTHYGILSYKAYCKDGFELILKIDDSSPACVKPQTAQILKHRNWGYESGKDIVLDKPSDITKSSYKIDPQKEKVVRERQKILEDALMTKETQYGGFQNRVHHLPWSSIGYDYVDHALEITILPDYFNTDNLPRYFEEIRGIAGNDIDIALSPSSYATPN